MTEPISVEERNALLEVLARYPQGAGVGEILAGLDPAPNLRTLQRRLKALVREGHVYTEGATRGMKYWLAKPAADAVARRPVKGALLVLTREGLEIQEKVSQPIQSKQHVRYHQKFLDSYEPNKTFYLSEPLRQKLFEMGRTAEGKYPAGTYARHIFHRLLIDLSWNSSRLEGNTYSLLETERLIEMGKAAEGKDLKDAQMILNHKAAIEFLVESAQEIDISRHVISNIHALLSDNLLHDLACGRLRSIPVGIGKSVYSPLDIPQVIEEYFDRTIDKAKRIQDPFEQSFFLMVQLPYLQAFEDVNKRTSRLAANIPLIKKNLCPLSFIDVPEQTYINGLLGVYELNRVELLRDVFVWAYERSCFLYSATRNTLGEPDPFRMRYRDAFVQIVAEIVRSSFDKQQAVVAIRDRANESIPAEDRSRFIEIAEREVQSLHEGSIARYRLKVSEYEKWHKGWQ